MAIMHDIAALNAARYFKVNTGSKSASTEKLSLGYLINRTADDAPGLTISEEMRSQICVLNLGSQNVQESISLVQTADETLVEIHEILQYANELAAQAANDTNTDANREAIQKEINEIIKEVISYLQAYLRVMQNQFEHVILNNDNSSENLQSAESKIRDTDMSEELMNETSSKLLQQAGISLMSQHNQNRRNI